MFKSRLEYPITHWGDEESSWNVGVFLLNNKTSLKWTARVFRTRYQSPIKFYLFKSLTICLGEILCIIGTLRKILTTILRKYIPTTAGSNSNSRGSSSGSSGQGSSTLGCKRKAQPSFDISQRQGFTSRYTMERRKVRCPRCNGDPNFHDTTRTKTCPDCTVKMQARCRSCSGEGIVQVSYCKECRGHLVVHRQVPRETTTNVCGSHGR